MSSSSGRSIDNTNKNSNSGSKHSRATTGQGQTTANNNKTSNNGSNNSNLLVYAHHMINSDRYIL